MTHPNKRKSDLDAVMETLADQDADILADMTLHSNHEHKSKILNNAAIKRCHQFAQSSSYTFLRDQLDANRVINDHSEKVANLNRRVKFLETRSTEYMYPAHTALEAEVQELREVVDTLLKRDEEKTREISDLRTLQQDEKQQRRNPSLRERMRARLLPRAAVHRKAFPRLKTAHLTSQKATNRRFHAGSCELKAFTRELSRQKMVNEQLAKRVRAMEATVDRLIEGRGKSA
ncbi:hypothetical protein VTK26DRAFT_4254 [Humicola hyalothermophila]